MTQEELNKVLENHQHWLRKDCKEWVNMRAILEYENLDGLDFRGAMLDEALLNYASLDGACLDRASLNRASLYKASLNGASLNGASLNGASLNMASLNMASLNEASLDGACLDRASLNWASLNKASLKGACLKGTSFEKASLRGASLKGILFNGISLKGVRLDEAKNLPFIPFACPDTGSFIGWKKAHGKIIKLEIPADAKRCSATSNKCRCDKAKVLEIQNIKGTIANITEISSNYDSNFIYKVGEIVSVDNFCDDRWQECSEGIHFFVNRQSAVEY